MLHAGTPVIEIYHLVQGVCVARTSSGIHIDSLEEGSALGHLDAVLGTPCSANILAKTYCTMYCLPVTEMLQVFEVRRTA
jgi:CRP-like cAMP-binding protein